MIHIVIVNWNSGPQVRDCVDSILEYGKGVVEQICVVDNDSSDGSRETVENMSAVDVVRADKNLGFAAACNLGASLGSSRYVLFLNPDTLLGPDSLQQPLRFMESRTGSRVGICGLTLVDEQGRVCKSCARFPTLGRYFAVIFGIDKLPGLSGAALHMRDWGHDSSSPVDHVMGAFYLMRREVFDICGGFDERFFVYLEDVDLSLRAHQAGWASWFLADTQIFHAGGGTSRQVKATRLFYSLRSRLLYGLKHFPRWQAWVLAVLTLFIEPFTRTAWCLLAMDVPGIRNTWSAYWLLILDLPKIFRVKASR